MKGVIAFVLCLSVASCAFLKFDGYKEQWQAWKTLHDKKYETDTEEEARYAIWRDNLRVCKTFKLVRQSQIVQSIIYDFDTVVT